jgi:predicted dehydrogenase
VVTDDRVTYAFEYDEAAKVRVAFIGAGGHAYRNVYPSFQYAPVDLVAICDLDAARATAYARQFGARASFTDHERMLAETSPEAVFIVTNYDGAGRPRATDLAIAALEAGAHVWMEKPTAASVADVRRLMAASERSGRFVMTGLKKTFFPSIVKAKEIVDRDDFGVPVSLTLRYPLHMPPLAERGDLRRVVDLLDHLPHPVSIARYLMGPVATMSYTWEPVAGASFVQLGFASGAIGTMHFAAGGSGTAPLERVEVIGRQASVIVDNGVRVTWHRPAQRPAYGRSASYIVPDGQAALVWEPEFSLGQLYNKNIFSLGYVPEIVDFCERVRTGTVPDRGSLAVSLEIAAIFEALCSVPPGETVVVAEWMDGKGTTG